MEDLSEIEIKHFNCYVTSRDDGIEGSFEFAVSYPLSQTTIQLCLLALDFVEKEMKRFSFVT